MLPPVARLPGSCRFFHHFVILNSKKIKDPAESFAHNSTGPFSSFRDAKLVKIFYAAKTSPVFNII